MKELRCCVLIPTFNNDTTLEQVIRDIAQYTDQIVIVNDGSTDSTATILAQYPDYKIVTHSPNQGKGMALRTGFQTARSFGYDYAITMDSDGQHRASDIPVFLDKQQEEPTAIIVGARNMTQENVPSKNNFAHNFSNFWFKLETGINLPDTQSGLRLYPIRLLEDIRFFTPKYEFELEVLVRAAWRGIGVCVVPIDVYYPKPEERITHFRPFQDFSRISVLNTVLVLVAIFYIKPRDFLRRLKKKLAELPKKSPSW